MIRVGKNSQNALAPIGQDRYGELFDGDKLTKFAIGETLTGKQAERRAKTVAAEIEKAVEITRETADMFNAEHDKMIAAQTRLTESAKKVSGQVRDAANKLSDGLLKLEKAADFNKLDRYVVLLERAAAAMSTLAELEKDGKLERIANALNTPA